MWSMTGGAEWSTGSRRVCGSYVDSTTPRRGDAALRQQDMLFVWDVEV